MTAQLSPLGVQKFYDNNGNPLAFGLLYSYAAGTATPQATYVDSTQTTQNTNPIQLNFRGECNLWLDPTLNYKLLLTDSAGNTVPNWPVDNIPGGPFISGSGTLTIPASLIPTPTNTLTLGNSTHSWANFYIGPNSIPILDSTTGDIAYYARTSAEIAAAVTPVSFVYQPGDLRRYGCDLTGGTNNFTQITNAINAATATGGIGFIYHPGGTILHASTIVVPNGVTVFGNDRNACIFTYNGTGDGWQNVNGPNSSGYGKVRFQGVKLASTNASNVGAAIEINAGGFSYYEIIDCWLFGDWKYGLILDAVEVCTVDRNIIDLGNSPTGSIWIVNGVDRVATQSVGFSNVITISNNQLSSSGGIGIIDDGGNNHLITGNNLNNHSLPMRIAGTNSLSIVCNSLESHLATGGANISFTTLALNGGRNVGQNTNSVVHGNGFFTDMAATNSELLFISQTYAITAITQAASAVVTTNVAGDLVNGVRVNPFANFVGASLQVTFAGVTGMTQINGLSGFVTAVGGSTGAWTVTVAINSSAFTAYSAGGTMSCFHSGFDITGNVFGFVLGRGGAVDVTNLANSFCGYNTDLSQSVGAVHYTGVHTDTLGNTLLPPQNGFIPTLGVTGYTWGDTRYRHVFNTALQYKRVTVTYSASMTFDLGTGNAFDITANNGTAFTINSPTNANDGNRFVVTIRNTSGGALGAITFGPSFKLGGAFTAPATGNQRSVEFLTDGGGTHHEINRTAADVAN